MERVSSRGLAVDLRAFFLGGVALAALCAPTASAQEVIQMAPIEVEAQGLRAAQTEGSGSYTTDITTAGSKTPTPVREVPQTVTVMTRQQLDDANLNTLEDAFKWTPGITVATGDTFSASLYSRGHEIFTYAVDGLVRPLLSLYGTAPDMVFFDRIEVLSGPTGLFNGTGEPAGTINLSRKRALAKFGASASAYAGSFHHYRGEADVTGPLNDSGTVRARVVGFGETEESFIDVVDAQKGGGYATLEYDPTKRTKLAFGGIYERQDVNRTPGLPTFADGTLIDLPRSTFVGAEWNRFESNGGDFFFDAEHTLKSGTALRFAARYYVRDVEIRSALPITSVDPSTGLFSLFAFARDYREKNLATDTSASIPFDIMGIDNEVIVGTDFRRINQRTKQQFVMGLGTQSIYAPNPDIAEPIITFPGVGPGFNLNSIQEDTQYGGYVRWKVRPVERLNLMAGTRLSNYRSETKDTGRNTSSRFDEKGEFTPFAGATFDLTHHLTAYTSYSEIYQPQSDLTIDATVVGPRTGKQVEVGLKGNFLDGALSAQAGAYWLRDENRAVADPVNTGFFVGTGEATTYGLETLVAGEPIPGLNIWASYAFTKTDLDSGDDDEFGEITPEHAATIWGKYTIQDGMFQGLSFGGGVRAVGEMHAISSGVTITAPSYVVADVQLGYRLNEHFSGAVTVNNVFDKKYFERVNETTRGNFYGAPRNFMVRVSGKF